MNVTLALSAACSEEAGRTGPTAADASARSDAATPTRGDASSDGGGAPSDGALATELGPQPDALGDALAQPDARSDASAPPPPVPLDQHHFVDYLAPYGTHTFVVPANVNWTSTRLYLKPGESATISASGTWAMPAWTGYATPTGPEGDTKLGPFLGGCNIGSLVAKVGLSSADGIQCVSAGATLVAPRAGILYLVANYGEADVWTLTGSMTVTVTSTGARVPLIEAASAAGFDYSKVVSSELEVFSPRNIHVFPTDKASLYKGQLAQVMATFDTWYDNLVQLTSYLPGDGQRLRWFPDPALYQGMYAGLAGWPICYDSYFLDGIGNGYNVFKVHEYDTMVKVFVHELGHMHQPSAYYPMIGISYMMNEAWADFLARYAASTTKNWDMDLFDPFEWTTPEQLSAFFASGTYQDFSWSQGFAHCFLDELRKTYGGWPAYMALFKRIKTLPASAWPANQAAPEIRWRFFRDQFKLATGADPTPTFLKYHIPL